MCVCVLIKRAEKDTGCHFYYSTLCTVPNVDTFQGSGANQNLLGIGILTCNDFDLVSAWL